MNTKVYIILLLIFIFFNATNAQNNYEFLQLSGENVSTQSITYAIKQDIVGNLWIASEEGVLKHNSNYYKVYNTYNGLPETINNRATEIFIDTKNNIWVGFENGFCFYNKDLDKFDLIESKGKINPSLITSINEDAKGIIWIGGFNGLWNYNPVSKKINRVLSTISVEGFQILDNEILIGTTKGLFSLNINSKDVSQIDLASDSEKISFINKVKNKIFVGTKNGKIYDLDHTNKKAKIKNINREITNPITDIIFSNDSFFIATDGEGIYKTDSNFKVLNHFQEDANNEISISSNGVYDLEKSDENILWVATYGGGINYLDDNRLPFQKVQHQLNDKNSIVANFTRAIEVDKNENLWFGTKKGVSIWNRKQNSWKHIKHLSSEKNNVGDIVLALESDDDFMWIGTYNKGLFKVNINTLRVTNYNATMPQKKLLDKIYAIYKDKKNNIWIGGIEKDLTMISQYNQVKTYPIQQVKSIIESRSGDILASGKNGVYKIDPNKETFGLIEKLIPNKNTLAYSTINAVVEKKNNELLIATNGAGLLFYNPITEKIKKLNVKSGMPSDIIQGILIDAKNKIWVSSTKGLAEIKTSEKDTIIEILDKKDGLSSTEYNYGSFKKINENTLAFGGVDGVTIFNPDKIINQNYKPQLVFDEFKLFNKTVGPSEKPLEKHINQTKEITLKSFENSIELKFTAILHSSPSKMKYSWKLEGFDEDWSELSTNNTATYTNLESDNYNFKVRAYNKYGNLSEERALRIIILSPWWSTPLAFIIYGILVIALMFTIIHFTSVIVTKKNAEEQIDFFNNITHEIKTPLTILLSSLETITNNEDDAVKESNVRIKGTIKRINSLFEQMLNFHRVTSKDSIFQEVSKIDLNNYFEKRIHNFIPLTEGRNLKIILKNSWPEEIFYFYKDAFDKIILNLLSNAIKYSFNDKEIGIHLEKTVKGFLKIDIIDQGLGIPKDQQKFILNRYYRARNAINSQSQGTGLGLIMTKKMVEKAGGSISFKSEENKGTTFTVLLKNLVYVYKETALNNYNLNDNLLEEDQLEIDAYSDAKILIAEDNDELRALLVNSLGNYFQIYEAKNGREGLEMTSQIFPDIILTDLIMPEMDGMEMSRKIKEDINLNHIPVFMLTVLQNSTQKLESIESGVSEYIQKPIDMKFLLAKIINTLKFQRRLREKYVHDTDTENASIFRNKSDKEFLENLENKIIENIENNSFSVHDLSKSFGMSRTSLYMKLKNLVDLSPQDFIIRTKLKHAKNLLIKGELSIKEVAYSSGFSNPKYFSTSFKKFYSQTPSGFIDSLKK